MKTKVFVCSSLLLVGLSACIRKEALNSEAAIDGCTGENVQTAIINYESKKVDVYVNVSAALERLQLHFVLPEGATIEATHAEEGDGNNRYDFSDGSHSRQFKVTAEDLHTQVNYDVNIIKASLPTYYSFETLSKETPYHILSEINKESGEMLNWSSGNPGFQLTNLLGAPDSYPTTQSVNGYEGNCVKLTTLSTGSLGASVKMPIAAGNLFIGNFDLLNALKDALKSTQFGVQFYKHPKALTGYYKYKAGTKYMDNGQEIAGKKDRFDIYAIMYEAASNDFMLDGTNALTAAELVMVAQIPASDAVETDDWKEFTLPFKLQSGKTIDEAKLRMGKYKLGIVFSSSVEGALFKGALESTLYVDEVRLECEEDDYVDEYK
ncbi:MAG: PCMD domain-containing protein [Mediterranea sp.]|jgi:hypothetical protein|nr:PCMD domain-containing protein [Mediterranea sp.]